MCNIAFTACNTPMPSLRNKILSAYGFSKIVMLAFAAVVFADLNYLQQQITEGEAVMGFREATLEMRRDEKNLFLYHDLSSVDQLLQQADAAGVELAKGRKSFAMIAGEAESRRIDVLLKTYREQIERYPYLDQAEKAAAREIIRDLGRELSEASQDLSRRERRALAHATRTASTSLLLAFAGVVLLGLASGFFLVRQVVRPLRELESGLLAIDEGRARELPLPSKDKEIHSFVEAFNAMLRHMRAQQDQVRRNEKAAALGVLVSGVAHELNNPLSNISTSTQLLIEEADEGDAELRRLWLSQIDGETERARRIVRRLLDSVRQPKLHVQRLAVSDLVQSSLALVDRHLPQEVGVCVEATPDLDVEVDRERMHQVFINLIKNAADAGARHITVSAQLSVWDDARMEGAHLVGDPAAVSQSPRALLMTVEDDGPGIAADVLEHVFDPFFTTRSGGDGTGLGLYLVEEIVSEHRGCITVESGASGGTRFSIWLPFPKDETA